jgi:hypothetical protein
VVEGDNTLEDVRQYLAEVREACAAESCTRVLVEENLRGPSLRTMDIFAIAARGGTPRPAYRSSRTRSTQ